MTVVARRWWMVALRGLAALVFGALSVVLPGAAFMSLVLLFGVYAIVDGVLSIAHAVRGPGEASWFSIIGRGVVSIAAGVVALAWPGITALVLLLVIAAWAVVSGVLEIVAAIRLRKEIQGEWLLALGGVLSILFGVLLAISPVAGVVVLGLWIGAYALVLGVVQLSLAFRLRAYERREKRPPSTGLDGSRTPQGGHAPPAYGTR